MFRCFLLSLIVYSVPSTKLGIIVYAFPSIRDYAYFPT